MRLAEGRGGIAPVAFETIGRAMDVICDRVCTVRRHHESRLVVKGLNILAGPNFQVGL